MAIFAVMTGVIMFNFNGFRSTITLDNLAQDIALSIRHVQVGGGAAISTNDPSQDEIQQGIYFPMTNGQYDKQFILFRDSNNNHLYDQGEEFDTIVIKTPDIIKEVDYGDSIDFASNVLNDSLGILFGRYKTSATFATSSSDLPAGVVRILVVSSDGTSGRYISVSKIGQVSIQNVTFNPDGTPIIVIPPPQVS